MRVVDTARLFCNFLLWTREVYGDLMGNFDPKKMISMHWQNWSFITFESLSICLFFGIMYNYVTNTMLFTSKNACSDVIERAHSITWYKQKKRQNRCHNDINFVSHNWKVFSDAQNTSKNWALHNSIVVLNQYFVLQDKLWQKDFSARWGNLPVVWIMM